MKIDIHNHILPENWPDLKEVKCETLMHDLLITQFMCNKSNQVKYAFHLLIVVYYTFYRNMAMVDGAK